MPALLLTLAIYLFLGLGFLGWGRIASRAIGLPERQDDSWLSPVWLGCAAIFLTLQLANLFTPLTAYVVVPLLAVGVVIALRAVSVELMHAPAPLLSKDVAVGLSLGLLIAGWIALRGVLLNPDHYDSGLYHFPAIRWIVTHPVVAGLGNLHGRLAFNSSFFVLVAGLNFEPLFGHGHSIANSFLLVLAMATMADLLRPLLRQPSLLAGSHPFLFGPPLLALPPLAYVAISSKLSSPSPDVAATLLEIVVFVMLCGGIARWRAGERDQDYRAMLTLALAVTLVTIKLSSLAFSLAIAAFVFAYWRQTPLPRLRKALQITLPAIVLAFVWALRGFLLSGALFYPSTIGYLPVEWAMPKAAIVEEANVVLSSARNAGDPWTAVLGNWDWLTPWFQDAVQHHTSFMNPLELSVVFIIGAAMAAWRSKWRGVRPLELAVLAPSLAAIAYWFFTAPSFRFANAMFFLLSLSACLLFLLSVQPLVGKRVFPLLIGLAFLFGNFHFILFARQNAGSLRPCAPEGTWIACVPTATWPAIPTVPLTTHVTASHLAVLTPATGDQCWDAPLPCTPYFNPRLELRAIAILGPAFVVSER